MSGTNLKKTYHSVDISKNPYDIDLETLSQLIDPKNSELLKELNGVDGLMNKLGVNGSTGLVEGNIDETIDEEIDHYAPYNSLLLHERKLFDKRRLWFGENVLPPVARKSLLSIVNDTLTDKMLRILIVVGAVSTIIGILQSLNVIPTEDGQNHEAPWAEGVAIFIAVIVVVSVSSLNNFQKELQYRKLCAKKEDRQVKVYRNGKTKIISSKEAVVGDIVEMEPGDLILVDGIFLSGYNLKCDESTTTGESDLIEKKQGSDVFMISGAKVAEGVGKYLVTAVGVNSFHGKTMLALNVEEKPTPLEEKLMRLTSVIAKLGITAGMVLFFALVLKMLISEAVNNNFEDPASIGIEFLEIFTETITIVVVAVPEGLPLAITLALVYAGKRMIKDNNFVRVISACEVMGHATTICSDKTGTLTQNNMTVVSGMIDNSASWENENDSEVKTLIEPNVWNILMEGIASNCSAFEERVDNKTRFVGNKTETALLEWQSKYGVCFSEFHDTLQIESRFPFSSEKKSMSTIVKMILNGKVCYRLHTKGASEIVFHYCSQIQLKNTTTSISPEITLKIDQLIKQYAQNALRTIAIAYRDFSEEEFSQLHLEEGGFPPTENMTLLGIFGIEDPLRPEVTHAVQKCHKAGVIVRMVTGDNINTAKAIASKCGIYIKGGICMEGPQFRELNDADMKKILPKLQILARSSPLDKQLLVEKLQEMGEVVAVTGDGTNDGAALKKADVGFSMGISGTEVAKEASSIILMDDNFSSIVRALMWGRTVNDAIKKFLQFQLTVSITAVIVTFVTGIAGPSAALNSIQLLWINMIMNSFAALALATEYPSDEVLDRYPESRNAPLITLNMWKMISFQCVYQIIVSCILNFLGPELFFGKLQNDLSIGEQYELDGIIFNTFVFMQLFNEIK
eukprot:NODE_145_length_15762_cov_0.655238.p2 type:complete len:910 gc:universal NODE_145_length_15762_cov_0.655238:6165-3436(-)